MDNFQMNRRQKRMREQRRKKRTRATCSMVILCTIIAFCLIVLIREIAGGNNKIKTQVLPPQTVIQILNEKGSVKTTIQGEDMKIFYKNGLVKIHCNGTVVETIEESVSITFPNERNR